MGRPPCCEQTGVKKGPWTPEEDIILVSYIQDHGPGNWRSVPTNTGLLRCSKSCRLRWTNYLRPGIKRGNFTDQEEKMIIHLQALLGNRWAAIASYLPQRTDNDIKNYWNTHLRKKLNKAEAGRDGHGSDLDDDQSANSSRSVSKGQWERRLQTDIHMAKQALCEALSLDRPQTSLLSTGPKTFSDTSLLSARHGHSTNSDMSAKSHDQQAASNAAYASNAENISRLLQGWMKSIPRTTESSSGINSCCALSRSMNSTIMTRSSSSEEDTMFSFLSAHSETSQSDANDRILTPETYQQRAEVDDSEVPLRLLEKWLFDDGGVPTPAHYDFMNMPLEGELTLF